MHGLLKNTWNPKGAGCTLCKSFTATYSLGKCLVNFAFGLHDYPILPGFCIELWAASLRHSKGTHVELVLGWCGAWQGGKEHSTHQCYGDSPSLQRCLLLWEGLSCFRLHLGVVSYLLLQQLRGLSSQGKSFSFLSWFCWSWGKSLWTSSRINAVFVGAQFCLIFPCTLWAITGQS